MAYSRIGAGWSLARSVRALISGDRGLLIYPVVSGIIGIVLFAATFAASYLVQSSVPIHWRIIAGLVAAYIVTAFVSTYFLVALLIAFKSYQQDQRIGMGEALSRTRPYTIRILEWALFYTVLVMILRAIESRFRGISQLIVSGIGSLGITIATFFAVPAILEKKLGPVGAVRESLGIIRSTIGPIFGGVAYIDLYTLVFSLSGFAVMIAGFVFMPDTLLKFVVGGAGAALLVLGLVLNYTYFNIFKLILYDYFNGGKLPDGFDEEIVQAAIRRRGRARF